MSGYGPSAGDVVALGGTSLRMRIPDRVADSGDEFHVGFAKTGRDGIGLAPVTTRESCDVVITNVIVMDPIDGIRVASIGMREGRITGVGRAGNPAVSDSVDIIVGSGTVVIDGEGLIATPGGIDTHVHALAPRVFDAEIASGVTTVLAQEAGPVWGVGLGSPWFLGIARGALEGIPLNVGLLGRASSSRRSVLEDAIDAHVCGFKVHEDTGATLMTIDTALRVADDIDVQVALHTDGLNETLSVADTLAVLDGRVAHAFHVEGGGGGHAPDVLTLAGRDHVIASSTNPTLPFGRNAAAETLDMVLFCHGLAADRESDLQIARARIRETTMAAENALHDMGVIPITSSDALGMGRAGETWWRTFAMADAQSRLAPSEDAGDDNARILRYLAKITINPALAHGLAHEVGRLAAGFRADIVLWDPCSFAAKPQLVLVGGYPAWGVTGDPNATIDGAEPLRLSEQFGALGTAPRLLGALVTNQRAAALADVAPTSLDRPVIITRGCRSVRGSQMVRHGVLGTVSVSPDGADVTWEGEPVGGPPADHVPLSRLHYW
ncbi:MAG: urease subunit alpha [Actinobacteria bacterium]|nr:urease subunit alpha [Actinomycetota bacterium]